MRREDIRAASVALSANDATTADNVTVASADANATIVIRRQDDFENLCTSGRCAAALFIANN